MTLADESETFGHSWRRIRSFPLPIGDSRCRQRRIDASWWKNPVFLTTSTSGRTWHRDELDGRGHQLRRTVGEKTQGDTDGIRRRLEERNCRIPDFDSVSSGLTSMPSSSAGSKPEYTAFSRKKNDSGRCAGPGPAVRRCVETTGQDGAVFQHVCLAVIVAVCHTVGAVSERYVDSDIFTVERY